MAGIEAGSDTRIADSILETVAQEQAYQELNDRLKQLEAEVKREGEEKAKLQAERDELGKSYLSPLPASSPI
jgi:predicted nuclease with TOPRIM domain